MDQIIFLDIETTGTDPKTSAVLEIAAVVVDDDLTEVDSFHAVLPYVRTGSEAPVVLAMHEANGLWAECEGVASVDPSSTDAFEEEAERVRAFFAEYPGAWLAGRAVASFDRPFLEHEFPGCTAGLSHRSLDLRTLWRMGDLVPGLWDGLDAPAPGPSHRAMADVRGDLGALRAMRARLTLLQERWAP